MFLFEQREEVRVKYGNVRTFNYTKPREKKFLLKEGIKNGTFYEYSPAVFLFNCT